MQIRGVIFDLDGTLVDSALDFAAMRRETGCPEGEGLLEYLETLAGPDQARVQSIIHRHEWEGAERAYWMPGALELLQYLQARAIPSAILTRNSREVTRHTLTRLGAPDIPALCREDAAPKPDPEGLLRIARDWQLPARDLVYVGDFRFDIEAAKHAGMHSALYLQDKNRDYADEADLRFTHFDELPTLLFRPA